MTEKKWGTLGDGTPYVWFGKNHTTKYSADLHISQVHAAITRIDPAHIAAFLLGLGEVAR